MEAAALSILLAAGFMFLRMWHVARILSIKEGQVVYLASVVAAVPLAILAASLLQITDALTTPAATAWLVPLVTAFADRVDEGGAPMTVAILALLTAPALGWLASLPFTLNPTLARASLRFIGEPHPLDKVLTEATDRELPVLVTLTSGKVYLGFSLNGQPYAQSGSQWLLIVPWLSGFRDECAKLQFTTDYRGKAWITDADGQPQHNPAFELALPLSSVQSVAPFDLTTYEAIFAQDEIAENAHQGEVSVPPSRAESPQALQREWRLYWIGFSTAASGAMMLSWNGIVAALFVVMGILMLGAAAFAPTESLENDG